LPLLERLPPDLSARGGARYRNTEIVTVRGNQIVEVEVYFGWSIPHETPAGGFIDEIQGDRQHP
jgi:hypothetical protein